jgi:hypothetical protein
MWPVAIVPFTYASSFLFKTEMGAQGFTVFFNLISMSLLPVLVFYLKISENYGHLGDRFGFYLRIFPSYSLSNALLFAGSGNQVEIYRQEYLEAGIDLIDSEDGSIFGQFYYSREPWRIANLLGDIYALAFHGAVGILLICIFEGLIC